MVRKTDQIVYIDIHQTTTENCQRTRNGTRENAKYQRAGMITEHTSYVNHDNTFRNLSRQQVTHSRVKVELTKRPFDVVFP